jgi:phosphoenolpyruvate carboxykinase (ATP)
VPEAQRAQAVDRPVGQRVAVRIDSALVRLRHLGHDVSRPLRFADGENGLREEDPGRAEQTREEHRYERELELARDHGVPHPVAQGDDPRRDGFGSRTARRGLDGGHHQRSRNTRRQRRRPRRDGQQGRRPQAASHQPRPEQRPAALQAALQRALRQAEPGRGLLLRPALQVAQHQRLPVALGQPAQLVVEHLPDLAPAQLIRDLRGGASGSAALVLPPAREPGPRFPGRAVGDAVQPAGQRRRVADGVGAAGEDEEGRLEGVFRVGVVGQHAPADVEDHRPVPAPDARVGGDLANQLQGRTGHGFGHGSPSGKAARVLTLYSPRRRGGEPDIFPTWPPRGAAQLPALTRPGSPAKMILSPGAVALDLETRPMSSPPGLDLSALGLRAPGKVHAHLSPPALVEQALRRGEADLSDRGALVALTGTHTGRAPKDRFLVVDAAEQPLIDWGSVNRALEPAVFDRLLGRVLAYLQGRELFVTDAGACADPRYRLPVRVITDCAWHALFARCLLRDPVTGGAGPAFDPAAGLTVLCAAGFEADPLRDGTRSEVFIVLHFPRRLVLVGGTGYAGEIKKAVFSYLNYLLPSLDVLPMHCSANVGDDGRAALFFGLSGTGKTTLSADPHRRLVGDDEHAWTDEGVFNLEGGCYAKCIRLSAEGEPQIYHALGFGSVLENVVIDPRTRRPDFDDESLTENTRAAYPLSHIAGAEPTGRAGHPDTVVLLTCDAFGVMPPLARLDVEGALYHFLSGYTARVAGTEAGVTQPEATFSTCFAAPFLPLRPARYAELLAERLRRHGSRVWLVNTGWTGGPPGGGGQRIRLEHTRAMVRAVLEGKLDAAAFTPDPIFNVQVPAGCPGVPAEVLQPRRQWADGAAYEAQARRLAGLFAANFEKHGAGVSDGVRRAGPRG